VEMPASPPPVAPDTGASSGWRARCEHVVRSVETNAGTPRQTAAALALGVFLSFSPFLGLQILIGIAAAFALRLSRVAVLVGLCANLPWIMLPWYGLTTAGAAAVLGISKEVDITAKLGELLSVPIYQPAFWGRTSDLISAFFWPFVMGPTVGAAVLAVLAYAVSVRILLHRARVRTLAAASPSLAADAQERAADRHVGDAHRARLQP
jgi:uncharacterized protein (DUF2062 family)